mgnify:CR=1 FL=1
MNPLPMDSIIIIRFEKKIQIDQENKKLDKNLQMMMMKKFHFFLWIKKKFFTIAIIIIIKSHGPKTHVEIKKNGSIWITVNKTHAHTHKRKIHLKKKLAKKISHNGTLWIIWQNKMIDLKWWLEMMVVTLYLPKIFIFINHDWSNNQSEWI